MIQCDGLEPIGECATLVRGVSTAAGSDRDLNLMIRTSYVFSVSYELRYLFMHCGTHFTGKGLQTISRLRPEK